MSLGYWLYHRKKYKLFVSDSFKNNSANNKNILALTYEHNWELPEGWNVKYFDVNSPLTIINTPDIVIEREFNDGIIDYEFLYRHVLKKVTPKVFWFIDAHTASIKRIKYCDNFDFIFVAHSPYINYVKQHTTCKNIFWLPLCYPKPGAQIEKNTAENKYPVSFIGTYTEGYKKRNEMIDFLKREYKEKFFAATDYYNSRQLICESKITTNCSLHNDLNFRVFEALGYGTEMVTDRVPDLDKIESLKEMLHYFDDLGCLKKHIDALIANNPAKKHDMHQVQEWIKQNHTMKNRITEMLQMIDTGKQVEYK